jgi:hypothetical protein
MSTIETIITNNQDNYENSIIKFNNMNNGNLNNTVTIRNDGYILCNTLMELSDSRTKYILGTSNFDDSLKKICNINTYNFKYINDSKNIIHKGVIAQELYKIIPSAVNIEKTNNFDDLHTVSNKELIGYLIDSIKALKNEIEKIVHSALDNGITEFDVSELDTGGCSITMDKNKILPNLSYEQYYKFLTNYLMK